MTSSTTTTMITNTANRMTVNLITPISHAMKKCQLECQQAEQTNAKTAPKFNQYGTYRTNLSHFHTSGTYYSTPP
jgi:hypothetical protein